MFSISNVNRARLEAMRAEECEVNISIVATYVLVETSDLFSSSGKDTTLDGAITKCWNNLMAQIDRYELKYYYAQKMYEKRTNLNNHLKQALKDE